MIKLIDILNEYKINSPTTNFYFATTVAVLLTASLYVLSVIRNWPSPKWPNESDDMSA
jgi:hypothetical protein